MKTLKPGATSPASPGPNSLLERDGIIIAVLIALTAVMTNPLVLHLANAVEDKQDALLNTWIIAWVSHSLTTDPLQLFGANIFYPYANVLAFSETLLPQGLAASPINIAFENPVLAYNLVLLFSFLLSGYAMYLLVFDITRNRGAGLVAGVIFAFSPFNLGNLAQIQLLSLGWLPLALFFLRRLVGPNAERENENSGRRLRIPNFRLKNVLLFSIFFSLQALSSLYYAFLAGLAVGLYIAGFLVAKALERVRRAYSSKMAPFGLAVVRLAIAAGLISFFTLPILLPYLDVQREMGFQRKLEENEPFSASFRQFTQLSPSNILYGRFLSPRPPIVIGNYPLDNLFPGLIALTLTFLGITSRHRVRWYWGILLIIAFVLSLGPRLFLAPSEGTDIQLPYRWFYEAFPFTHALRAPVRFDALVTFCLAGLAGLGAHRTVGSRQKAVNAQTPTIVRNLPAAHLLLISGLVALEYLAIPAANIAPVPVGDQVPLYARWLAQEPPTVILELPMLTGKSGEPLDLTPQYLSTFHWQRTPDGYSGFIPPKRGEIAYEMQTFPSERAMSLLQALQVQYVIVHSDRITNLDPLLSATSQEPDLKFVQRMDADYIYQVAPRNQEYDALEAHLYLPPVAARQTGYRAYLILLNKSKRSVAVKPDEGLSVVYGWFWPGERVPDQSGSIQVFPPLVTSKVSVIPIPLTTAPQMGRYLLAIKINGMSNIWDLSSEVTVQENEQPNPIVLPTQAVLSTPMQTEYRPGNTVPVNLTWIALAKVDAYYSVSIRVVDAQGNKVANVDRQPAVPTMYWTPDSRISDHFELPLPQDLAPGRYSVQLLMYQADQGLDALLLDDKYRPQDSITLGEFQVK